MSEPTESGSANDLRHLYERREAAAAIDPKTHALTAALLKSARPAEVLRCVIKRKNGKVSAIFEPFSTDYSWLDVKSECEGYDPAGPNSPTYYRMVHNPTDGKRYYISTIKRPDGQTLLLMTDLDECDPLEPPAPHWED